MKKSLKKSSYRKAVINGLLIFGGIALLTTGFATWVIGASNTKDDMNNTNVTVDTAKRNNITLTVELSGTDNGVHIGEDTTKGSGNFLKVDGNTDSGQGEITLKPTDFVVNIDLTLTVGDDVQEKPNKIKFDFKYGIPSDGEGSVPNNGTDNNKVKITSDTANAVHQEGDGEFTYIDISAQSTLLVSSFTSKDEEGGTTYTYTGKDVTLFEWGTFFDKKSPSEFYNDLYDGEYLKLEDQENTFYGRQLTNNNSDVNAVFEELWNLHTAFNEKTIVVTAEAVYEK